MGLVFKTGIATSFGINDKYNPNEYAACLHRNLRETDHVVAHRTLPCGSTLIVFNPRTNKMTRATVGDRGPRSALVDLGYPVAKAIGLNGYEKVVLVYVKK